MNAHMSNQKTGGIQMIRKVYILENLDCANCAAKIEQKFNDHKDVQEAVITFSTKQLRLTAEDPDSLIPELTQIARTVEGEVVISPRDDRSSHAHDHGCGCGHHQEQKCDCGHHHEHACSCGGHHHDHEHACGCGGHHHDHGHACGCDSHHHEHHSQ